MCVNAQTIPAGTVPGIRGGNEGKKWKREAKMIYLIHCENLCKCYNVPPPSTRIEKKKDILAFSSLGGTDLTLSAFDMMRFVVIKLIYVYIFTAFFKLLSKAFSFHLVEYLELSFFFR
jgi:hypothetical protein